MVELTQSFGFSSLFNNEFIQFSVINYEHFFLSKIEPFSAPELPLWLYETQNPKRYNIL